MQLEVTPDDDVSAVQPTSELAMCKVTLRRV